MSEPKQKRKDTRQANKGLPADMKALVRMMCHEGGDTIRKIAERCGLRNHTALSLAMNDRYKCSTAKLEAKLRAGLEAVACPHLSGQRITVQTCVGHRTGRAPTHSPQALNHWRDCQQCPNNPAVQPNLNAVSARELNQGAVL